MAVDTSLGPFSTSFEPIPQGPVVDPKTGALTGWWRNHLEGGRTRNGEIISGINRNRQNIIQLETDYTAADGAISSAYIAADAVVASDAAGALAVVSSEITAARDGEVSLLAKISSVETAFASADSAIASDVSTLSATVTTIGSDLDTAEAAIVTNAASITTEASARASGDSANASSISTLSAKTLTVKKNLVFNPTAALGQEGWTALYAAGPWTAIPDPDGGYFTLGWTTTPINFDQASKNIVCGAGVDIAVSTELLFTGSFTGGSFQVGCLAFNSSDALISGVAFNSTAYGPGASGDYTFELTGTTPANTAYIRFYLRAVDVVGASSGAVFVRRIKVENNTIHSQWTDDATVTTTAKAMTAGGVSQALLAFNVNTGTNAAELKLVSTTGGSWNGSAISLTADEITLDGDVVITGTLTTEKLEANAVTNTGIATASGPWTSAKNVWQNIASKAVTVTGGVVKLTGQVEVTAMTASGGTVNVPAINMRMRRGSGTTIRSQTVLAVIARGSPILYFAETPAAGSYTYYLDVQVVDYGDGTSASLTTEDAFFEVAEFKR